MTTDALTAFMAEGQARVEQALDRHLPPGATIPCDLHEAMRYAALGDGKRVRPVLVYAAGQAVGVPPERLDGPATAVELIHAYSLIHDDLPAMDDDDLRRGRPTCHRVFGEAVAILAGDALQSLAFQVLATDAGMAASPAARVEMIELLSRASGSRGMAGGQAMDLAATGQSSTSLAQLDDMHIHKTGALIRASVRLGALSGPAVDVEIASRLEHYAKCIGLAFQIRDDILDVEGETEVIGKTQGKDATQEKVTYPALLGLNEAKERARELQREALDTLDPLDHHADPLRWIANYIIDRDH